MYYLRIPEDAAMGIKAAMENEGIDYLQDLVEFSQDEDPYYQPFERFLQEKFKLNRGHIKKIMNGLRTQQHSTKV